MTILSEPGAARPTARFAYSWDLENGRPPMDLYRVTGGKFDGSDVGVERLIELGIAVPDLVEVSA